MSACQANGEKAAGAEPRAQQEEAAQGPRGSRGQEHAEEPAAASPLETSPLLDSLTASSAAVHTTRVTPASLGDSAHAGLHNGPSSRSGPKRGGGRGSGAIGADSNGGSAGQGQGYAFTKGCYFLGKAVWGKARHTLCLLLQICMRRSPTCPNTFAKSHHHLEGGLSAQHLHQQKAGMMHQTLQATCWGMHG